MNRILKILALAAIISIPAVYANAMPSSGPYAFGSLYARVLAYLGLTESIACGGTDDTTAISNALVDGANILLRGGTCKITAISKSSITATVDMADNTTLEPAGSSDIPVLLTFTSSNIHWKRFIFNGLGLVEIPYKDINGASELIDYANISNIGYPVHTATTDGVHGLYFTGTAKVEIGTYIVGSGWTTVGDGTLRTGDFLGSIRGIEFISTGKVHIHHMDWSNNPTVADNGNQIDIFQANTGTAGGLVDELVARYNETTRRVVKVQSGNWTVANVDVREAAGFTCADGNCSTTQIGAYNLNMFDYANAGAGSLDVLSGYADCSGFSACFLVSIAGSGSINKGPTLYIQKPTLTRTRSGNISVGALSAGGVPVGVTGGYIKVPTYKSSRWYLGGMPGQSVTSTNTTLFTTDTLYAVPHFASHVVDIKALEVRTSSSNASSGASAKVCIYDSTGVDGAPNKLLGSTASGTAITDSATNTSFKINLDAVVHLSAGLWYSAIISTAVTTEWRPETVSASTGNSPYTGAQSTGDPLAGSGIVYGYTGSGSYASGCPDPFPSPTEMTTIGTAPAMAFQVN